MPRPKKIVQDEVQVIKTSEATKEEIQEEVEVISLDVAELVVIEPIDEPQILSVEEQLPSTTYKVYHLGNFVVEVEENSDQLLSFLEANKKQLYENVEKLKVKTDNQEDLVLFNIPETDNRKYNSLAQYFQQNGLAPQPPKITDWMTYYKSKYSFVTDEEIAIQVFGPLDYSFEIAN